MNNIQRMHKNIQDLANKYSTSTNPIYEAASMILWQRQLIDGYRATQASHKEAIARRDREIARLMNQLKQMEELLSMDVATATLFKNNTCNN